MTWIKIEINLPDKPEVYRIARALELSREAVVGHLIRWWAWLDSNTVDGGCHDLTVTDIDEISRCPGFADALAGAGWLTLDANGAKISVPNFEKHNGTNAKNRAQGAARQARYRQNLSDADVTARPSPDKKRVELKRSAPPAVKRSPDQAAKSVATRDPCSSTTGQRQPSSAAEVAISECIEMLQRGPTPGPPPAHLPQVDASLC